MCFHYCPVKVDESFFEIIIEFTLILKSELNKKLNIKSKSQVDYYI